jgi:predicted nucleic acid-binding protein
MLTHDGSSRSAAIRQAVLEAARRREPAVASAPPRCAGQCCGWIWGSPMGSTVLDQIELIDLGQGIRILARTVEPVTVRSLDAIHLATALHYPLRADLVRDP